MTRLFLLLLILLLPVTSWAADLATDNFNRADGGLGGNWTTVTGLGAPQIASNLVQTVSVATDAEALYTGASWPNDQYAYVMLVNVLTNTNRAGGVILRGATGSRTEYRCLVYGPLDGATATIEISRYAAGAQTIIRAGSAINAISPGDVFKCDVTGTTITTYVNGTLKTTDTDANIASGSAGLSLFVDSGLVTDTQLDIWGGGPAPAGGGCRPGSLMLMGVGC